MADEYNGIPNPEDQNPEHGKADQNDNIPDWMKDAGWETSSGTFDESKPVFDDLGDEDEIVPADIPAWLEEAAPEGFTSDPNAIPAFEGLDVDEPFITTGDLVPPASMAPAEEPAEPDEPQQPKEEKFDIPSWLENLELDEDSQETAVAWLENMPESLRATEEELQAAKQFPEEEPEVIEEPVDELAWVDDMAFEADQPLERPGDDQAALSEDLVASELIPETSEPEQIFEQEEIQSMDSDLPSWLKELGDDEPKAEGIPPGIPLNGTDTSRRAQDQSIPDWLRASDGEPPATESATPPSRETSDFPDWLTDFEDSKPVSDGDLDWLDTLEGKESLPETSDLLPSEEEPELTPDEPAYTSMDLDETIPSEPTSFPEESIEESIQSDRVSPNDETLNAQVPEWLTNLDNVEELEEEADLAGPFDTLDIDEPDLDEEDFESPDSWLDQISEKPLSSAFEEADSEESDVIDWLDEMDAGQYEPPSASTPEEIPPVELETAKYLQEEELFEEEQPDDLPDWLSELRETEDEPISLEDAIRRSDHDLNEAEVDFLSRVEEKQEDDADWLSKLDGAESEPDHKPSSPPIDLEPLDEETPSEEQPHAAGGILERLKDTSEFKSSEEVPQWLADIKKEEDPQETAVLWLQQFVNRGDEVDIKDEIKRYTDELDPGDSIPKWMEDLKNEEDPQTTAMLWLEKLSAARQSQPKPEPTTAKEEDSGWLADLEREAAESVSSQAPEDIKDFNDEDEGWLADLEIDRKLKSEEDELPEWSKSEKEPPESEPPWMKATSPLEGELYTDELAGDEEKETEIPEWLAGYEEGERPEEEQYQESPEGEEYTWLSATDTSAPPRTPLDLNKAAISQLERILGISHQIAKGIVTYREKQGPYRDISDLKNVPEITDEQTIDILKPEVFIGKTPQEDTPVPEHSIEPKPETPPRKTAKKPAKSENFEEMLVTARTRIDERSIPEATNLYAILIKKKKFLDEVIEDLQKAYLDHPLEISIPKTLGDAFMQKDMLDEALEAYSKAEDLLT